MSRIPYFLGDSPRESRTRSENFAILLMLLLAPLILLLGAGAVIINFSIQTSEGLQKNLESPENRQIILVVPRSSRVNAQVTSENNTVNLQNL